jgi:hypothetical protein
VFIISVISVYTEITDITRTSDGCLIREWGVIVVAPEAVQEMIPPEENPNSCSFLNRLGQVA